MGIGMQIRHLHLGRIRTSTVERKKKEPKKITIRLQYTTHRLLIQSEGLLYGIERRALPPRTEKRRRECKMHMTAEVEEEEDGWR